MGGWGRGDCGRGNDCEQTGRSVAGRAQEGSSLGNISLSLNKECPLGCVSPRPSCLGNYQARPAELCRGRVPWRPAPSRRTEGRHSMDSGRSPLPEPDLHFPDKSLILPRLGATEGHLGAPVAPAARQGQSRHILSPRRHHTFSKGPSHRLGQARSTHRLMGHPHATPLEFGPSSPPHPTPHCPRTTRVLAVQVQSRCPHPTDLFQGPF